MPHDQSYESCQRSIVGPVQNGPLCANIAFGAQARLVASWAMEWTTTDGERRVPMCHLDNAERYGSQRYSVSALTRKSIGAGLGAFAIGNGAAPFSCSLFNGPCLRKNVHGQYDGEISSATTCLAHIMAHAGCTNVGTVSVGSFSEATCSIGAHSAPTGFY